MFVGEIFPQRIGIGIGVWFSQRKSSTVDPAAYYVSSLTGSDLNDGTSPSKAVATISKINTLDLSGTRKKVLFKRGETFTGALTVGYSGTAENPVEYGAYGTGEKPIISGFTTVTEWTDLGGNIWESTNAVSTLTYLNIVLVNGKNTPMGRTPNDGQVYAIDAVVDDSYIEASELTGTPDYTGGQVVIRKEAYAWQVANITSQSTNRLYYTDVYSGTYVANVGDGFFIQAHASTLDTQGEWYYNTSTKKLQIYSTSQPTGVFVPTVETLFSAHQKSNIKVKNIDFRGANQNALNFNDLSDAAVTNCNVEHIGFEGVYFSKTLGITVTDNVIKNCNFGAIFSWSGTSSNQIVTNNYIDSTMLVIGIGRLYPTGAIHTNVDGALIQHNVIKNSGKEGIKFVGVDQTVKNNFIDGALLILSDGGGIYTYNSAGSNVNISDNIIVNLMGYNLGEVAGYDGVTGIYLDSYTRGVTVQGNTIEGGVRGINNSNNANNNKFIDNTIFNSEIGIAINNSYPGVAANGGIDSLVIKRNKIIVKDINLGRRIISTIERDDPLCFNITSLYNDVPGMFLELDSNYYARPLLEDTLTLRIASGGYSGYLNLDTWQQYLNQDANSSISTNFTLSSDSIVLHYNEGKTNKTIQLNGLWRTVDGEEYRNSITLAPFKSIVLIQGDYEREYANLYQAFTTKPSIDTAKIQNELVVDLKTYGLWNKADIIYVTAQNTQQSATRNWINPYTVSYIVNTSNCLFTPYEGFTGDAASNKYMTASYNPATNGVNYTLNSASLSVYSRLQIVAGNGLSGTSVSTNYIRLGANISGNFTGGLNTSSFASVANTITQGLFTIVRRGSTETEGYINSVSVVNNSAASTSVPSNSLRILGTSSTSTSNNQISFVFMGGALSDTEVANMNTAIEKYMDAIGKGVQ